MAVVTVAERRGQVLVLEDEYLVSLSVTSLLEDLGFQHITLAARVSDGCKLAENEELTLAVLDINVAGEMSWPVAEALKRRNVPFLFVSGYLKSAIALPTELAGTPVCAKPLDESHVTHVIDAMLCGAP